MDQSIDTQIRSKAEPTLETVGLGAESATRAPDPRLRTLGLFLAFTAALMLSVNNAAQGFYYAAGGTVSIMLLARYIGYVLIAGGAFVASGRPLIGPARYFWRALFSGLIYAAGMIALLSSLTRMEISLAILTLYTFPIVLMVLDAVADRKIPSPLAIVAAVGAFAGLAIALEFWDAAIALEGLLYASGASLCFALTFFCNARWLAGASTGRVTLHMKASGLLLVIAYAYVYRERIPDELTTPMLGAGLAALTAYLIAFVAMFRAVETAGAGPTAGMMNLEPLMTLGLAAFFLAEELTPNRVTGAVIVVAAVLLLQWTTAERPLLKR